MARTASIGLRVEPALLEAAKKAAADDSRSVASLLEKLLKAHLTAHGYTKTETAKAPPAAGRSRGRRRAAP